MVSDDVVFGFGAPNGFDDPAALLSATAQADRDGLDLFSIPDHPYLGSRLDAYADVTNLPTRPAPILARTAASLSALSGGRLVLGMGAGGDWGRISDLGVRRLSPRDAVTAFEEAIVLIRLLSGGGPPVDYHGDHYAVSRIDPSPTPAPAVWTGSVGPRSLAATGRVADGWIPGHAADWFSQRYRESRPYIDDAAMAAGRDPREIRTVFNLPGQITERPLPATRERDGRWIGGSTRQWVEELTEAVLHHGASGFTLFSDLRGGTAEELTLRRWATEVAPAVREAVAKEAGVDSVR